MIASRTGSQGASGSRLLIVVAIATVFLSGLALQFIWSTTTASQRRRSITVLQHLIGPVAVGCGAATRRDPCRPEADGSASSSSSTWSVSPPQRLANVCRQLRSATKTSPPPLLLLVFVPTGVNATSQRAAVRQTWGSGLEHLSFLVQLKAGQPIGAALAAEVAIFDDIFVVRGPHADTYECLTLKLLAFLRWHAAECAGVFSYLLKSDHDAYWHAASLRRLLLARLPPERRQTPVLAVPTLGGTATAPQPETTAGMPSRPEILGSIQRHPAVRRDLRSKFCTPREAYQPDAYPDYMSGGPGYLLSAAAAAAIAGAADAASETPAFWLEDVFITGMLAASSSSSRGQRRLRRDNQAATTIKLVHSHSIRLGPDSVRLQSAVLKAPPLGVHGLTGRQMRLLHRWMQLPEVDWLAKKIHRFE